MDSRELDGHGGVGVGHGIGELLEGCGRWQFSIISVDAGIVAASTDAEERAREYLLKLTVSILLELPRVDASSTPGPGH